MTPSNADISLTAIDDALISPRVRMRPRRPIAQVAATADDVDRSPDVAVADAFNWKRFGWLELFLAVNFLWGALLFVPGAQQIRGYVRALPYVTSLGMLVLYAVLGRRASTPRSTGLLLSALVLLVLNLLHATTQFSAGLAQCVFQLSIAAPLFWAAATVKSPRALERLLWLVFLMNGASAGLGVLQVYFPEQFMPPQFSSLGMQLNRYYLDGLSYSGADNRIIIRPPGLTDQPGGAALAGALTALLGLGFYVRSRAIAKPHAVALVGMVIVGLVSIYLTQTRSVLLTAIGAAALLCLVALRRGRIAWAGGSLVMIAFGVVAAFAWASSVGGEAMDSRFLDLRNGVLRAYQENRGGFLQDTIGDLLNRFPLGAGVGRWGMMNTYFGNPLGSGGEPLYVEIQLTGWLFDGGAPMWLLYGGAILVSIWTTFKSTATRDTQLFDLSLIVLTLQAFIAAMAMTAPVFNTQLGMLFWALGGWLHGAHSLDDDPSAQQSA